MTCDICLILFCFSWNPPSLCLWCGGCFCVGKAVDGSAKPYRVEWSDGKLSDWLYPSDIVLLNTTNQDTNPFITAGEVSLIKDDEACTYFVSVVCYAHVNTHRHRERDSECKLA